MAESAFTVVVEETTAPVQAGERLTVTVAIENTGEEGTAAVSLLDFEGESVASEELELDAGAEETVELSWTPDADAVGTGELTVTTESDSTSETVTVEDAPPAFEVDISEADEHITEGAVTTVLAEITNTGTLDGTQVVEITVDDELQDERELTLAGGEQETLEFEYETSAEDAPEVTVSVSTDDDSASESIRVVGETVTPLRPLASKSGMGLFGWLMFLGMAILLLPLLPFFIALKLIEKLTGNGRPVR